MKGQISVEFLIIIGILSIAMLPVLFAMNYSAQTTPDKIAIAKATFSAARLRSAVNSVGSLGFGSSMVTQIEMPTVEYIQISNKEIAISVMSSYGDVAIIQPVEFNITSTTGFENVRAEGTYLVDIHSNNDGHISMSLR